MFSTLFTWLRCQMKPWRFMQVWEWKWMGLQFQNNDLIWQLDSGWFIRKKTSHYCYIDASESQPYAKKKSYRVMGTLEQTVSPCADSWDETGKFLAERNSVCTVLPDPLKETFSNCKTCPSPFLLQWKCQNRLLACRVNTLTECDVMLFLLNSRFSWWSFHNLFFFNQHGLFLLNDFNDGFDVF